MATIDSSIAMSYRAPEIQNPINAYAKGQELQVNALKMQEYQRGVEEQNALRQLVKEGLDPQTPEFAKRAYQVSPELGVKIAKSQADLKKSSFEASKLETEAIDGKLKQSRQLLEGITTPEQYMAWHEANHRDPVLGPLLASRGITADQSRARIVDALNRPGGLEKLINESRLGVQKFAEMNTLSAFQKQDLDIKREGQRLQYDPTTQAKIAGAKKRAEGEVAEEIQGKADVKANRKALATAGYDPVTGKDNISKLIQDSTGSFAGAGTDLAGRVIGVSTKGAQAISQLKTFESKLTQDILGGKLGAGISNTDREFIVAAIGEIANSTLPVETRQAAWNAVKERMRVAGMVEAPKAPANNVNVPGVGSQVNTPGGAAAPAARPSLDSIFAPPKKL